MKNRLLELVRFRGLILNLVVRDLKVRYKNSVLGIFWSWLNPLFMMVVYTVVFTIMQPGNIGIPEEQFPAFVLCALLPWNLFATSVTQSVGSIVENADLVKKVYFPREILPLSVVLSNLVNFGVSMLVLIPIMLLLRVPVTPWILLLPVVILIQFLFMTGVSLLLCTLNVFYRDTKVIIDVVMMAWLFVTPIFYPINKLPQSREILGVVIDIRRWTRILNPMASLVAAYRDVLFYGRQIGWDFLARTALTAAFVFVVGYGVFYRYSRLFGEEV
ncbi:MAG: ABC transporter permease [Anaerolineae bacterium]|nr:ABC transporter permease [Anaerolineae bacterium]